MLFFNIGIAWLFGYPFGRIIIGEYDDNDNDNDDDMQSTKKSIRNV
jgi:hypothetical protein